MKVAMVALAFIIISSVGFAQNRTVDKAPSGNSTQRTDAFPRTATSPGSSVSQPGRNGTVDVSREGNRTRMDFDPKGSEVTGTPHRDTTIIYHDK